MMGFIDARIGIQSWIDHDPADEVFHDGGDVIHPTQSNIERLCSLGLHRKPP
jgi:hypothetical protein